MKHFLRWTIRIVLTLAIILAAGVAWKWDDINRLLAVNSMFAEEKIVNNFSNMNTMFHNVEMDVPNDDPLALPPMPLDMPDGLTKWVEDRSVTSIVVLFAGNLVYEEYFQGTADTDRRISWSVAKSFLSALMGIILDEGAIDSIDDPVTKYAPALIGSAYETTTIRNVLNMASGVTFNEDYLDFNSDINKMGRIIGLGGSMDGFATDLTETTRAPGERWQYVSIDTHILGMVIRGATGRSIPDLMTEKLLTPMGLEADPYYITDGNGVAFVLGGLNLTTRDYARFGLLYARMGFLNGKQIVPREWILESTRASAPNTPDSIDYGMQWWIPANARPQEYFARGIYGQYIYHAGIVTSIGTVIIAVNSADRGFREPGSYAQNLAMFREITESIVSP